MLPRSGFYRSNHWDGCMCEDCADTFRRHNPSAPNLISCDCRGCQKRHTEQMNVAARDSVARTITHQGSGNMAGINICERDGCESFIRGRALGGVTLVLSSDDNIEPFKRTKRLELCPACVQDIYNILFNAPVGERERAYSTPFNPETMETDDALNGVTNEQLAAALLTRMMADPNMRKSITGGSGDTIPS